MPHTCDLGLGGRDTSQQPSFPLSQAVCNQTRSIPYCICGASLPNSNRGWELGQHERKLPYVSGVLKLIGNLAGVGEDQDRWSLLERKRTRAKT